MRKMKNINKFLAAAIAVCLVACSSHEEKVKEEHNAGKEKVEEKAALVEGIGEGLKSSGKDAMSALSEGVGAVVKGAEEGFDKGLTKVNVKADTSVSVYGMKIGKCGKYFSDSLKTNVVSVYTIFEENVNTEMMIVAIDGEKMEVGRSLVKVNEKEGTTKYIDYAFDKRVNIDIVKEFKLAVKFKKKK
jgi:hypothetical protein